MTDAERQDMTCATCVWFRPHTEQDVAQFLEQGYTAAPGGGECRRFPPREEDDHFECFPPVKLTCWCGEWRK